jgi:hypothetical protein
MTVPGDDDPTIVYCIATWFGHRRFSPNLYRRDRSCYLKRHIKRILGLKHALSAIVVISPRCNKRYGYGNYLPFLDSIPRLVDPIPCYILERDNRALSYGSWFYAYEMFGSAFSHYFLIEDDYVPAIDHFDTEFLSIMNQIPDCGVVFSCLSDIPMIGSKRVFSTNLGALNSNGLVASWAFEKARPRLDFVSHKIFQTNYSWHYQVDWTGAFGLSGITVKDVRDRYRVQYNRGIDKVWYHTQNDTAIIISL